MDCACDVCCRKYKIRWDGYPLEYDVLEVRGSLQPDRKSSNISNSKTGSTFMTDLTGPTYVTCLVNLGMESRFTNLGVTKRE